MSESQIPNSWESCALGDVVDYGRTDKAEPSEISEDAWILELEDIEKDTSRLLKRVQFSARQSKSTKNRFDPSDVLYGKLRPYLNKVIRADGPGYCSTEIVPLRETSAIDGGYLFHWLKSPAFLTYVGEVSHGLNMPRLGTQAGRKAPLILAPLNEQRRIADKLERILARVSACRERLDRVPAILRRFRQSVLAAATSGRLTKDWREKNVGAVGTRAISFDDESLDVPETWGESTLRDLIDQNRPLCYGVVQPGPEDSEGVSLIRVQDLSHGGVLHGGLRTVSAEIDDQYKRSRVQSGDILISVVGTIGRIAIVPPGLQANIARAIARVACRGEVKAEWVSAWLSCAVLQWWLTKNSREVARKTLNLAELGNVMVALPSEPEQAEIAQRTQQLFEYADRIEASYKAARTQVDGLTPALLAKAFRGELVPQDPSDEPASVLLERIRVERAEQPMRKPRRRARGKSAPRASRKGATMTKSRQDEDVKEKPYLTAILREAGDRVHAEDLFRQADLALDDFYKQLAWEVANGHIRDDESLLVAV